MVSSELGNKFFPSFSESKIRGKLRCEFIVCFLSAVLYTKKILRRHQQNSADIAQLLKNCLRMKKHPGLKKRTCGQLVVEKRFRDAAVTPSAVVQRTG